MSLPQNYLWLANEQGPRMIVEALKLFGTIEAPGKKDNPTIIKWAKEVGGKVADVYKADEIPWCGLFMAVVAKRAAKKLPSQPLWALNWGGFGKNVDKAMLGDVLVFTRKTSTGSTAGHVALYVGEDDTCYHCLGGNQKDSVCITRIEKNRLYKISRPAYNVQPKNVRVIKLKASGGVSSNEA